MLAAITVVAMSTVVTAVQLRVLKRKLGMNQEERMNRVVMEGEDSDGSRIVPAGEVHRRRNLDDQHYQQEYRYDQHYQHDQHNQFDDFEADDFGVNSNEDEKYLKISELISQLNSTQAADLDEKMLGEQMPHIKAVDMDPVFKVRGVGLSREPLRGVGGEPCSRNHSGTAAEQLECGLISDLNPSSGH